MADDKKKEPPKDTQNTLARYFGEGKQMSEDTVRIAKNFAKRTQGRRRGARLVESLDRYEQDKLKKDPK
ncbi:MAG: hypothetical protein V1495_04785 [Pseudomonadota bacterium]